MVIGLNKVVPRSNPPFVGGCSAFLCKRGDTVSGENRRSGGWLLPVIVVLVGAFVLIEGMQRGTLSAATLRPVNWAGIALMVAGLVSAFMKKPALKLIGVLACGIGAILVICL